MEDNKQQQQQISSPMVDPNNSPPPTPTPTDGSNKTSNEPVRSRWTPKPEQILILESIFNSGMVNPPKDETVRIRKLLEKFGAVGDANVFYWFQNRRSRSRRRQRQIQATLLNDQSPNRSSPTIHTFNPSSIQFEPTSSSSSSSSSSNTSSSTSCFDPSNSFTFLIGGGGGGGSSSSSSSCGGRGIGSGGGGGSSSSSSSCGGRGIGSGGGEEVNFYSISNQLGLTEMEQCQNVTSNMNYQQQQQPGFITVFINGVPTEVPNGPLDMRNMFGQDVMLVYSSGVPVPFNEYGFSLHSLQMGENYFLVSRSI